MKKKVFVALLLFLAAVNLTPAQSREEKIKTDIRQVMNAQVKAWNEGDIDGFMRGYWKSEEMTFVSGDNVSRGWQAALDRYKKSYNTRAKMGTLIFSDLKITVLSKNSAVVLGSWALEREPDNPKGKFTLIFRKTADGWKIVHDHTS